MQLLEAVVPGEETAINRTCVAALFSEKAAVVGITKSEEKKMTKAMKAALIHYGHQRDRGLNTNARSPRRSLIRSIFYYLHSTREKATNLQIPVPDKVMSVVEKFIRNFSRDFLNDCPMRDKALFYNALGDLHAQMVWYISILKRLLTPLTMQFCYINLQTMDLIWVPYDSLPPT